MLETGRCAGGIGGDDSFPGVFERSSAGEKCEDPHRAVQQRLRRPFFVDRQSIRNKTRVAMPSAAMMSDGYGL
jgi:hypothetical protein